MHQHLSGKTKICMLLISLFAADAFAGNNVSSRAASGIHDFNPLPQENAGGGNGDKKAEDVYGVCYKLEEPLLLRVYIRSDTPREYYIKIGYTLHEERPMMPEISGYEHYYGNGKGTLYVPPWNNHDLNNDNLPDSYVFFNSMDENKSKAMSRAQWKIQTDNDPSYPGNRRVLYWQEFREKDAEMAVLIPTRNIRELIINYGDSDINFSGGKRETFAMVWNGREGDILKYDSDYCGTYRMNRNESCEGTGLRWETNMGRGKDLNLKLLDSLLAIGVKSGVDYLSASAYKTRFRDNKGLFGFTAKELEAVCQ